MIHIAAFSSLYSDSHKLTPLAEAMWQHTLFVCVCGQACLLLGPRHPSGGSAGFSQTRGPSAPGRRRGKGQ